VLLLIAGAVFVHFSEGWGWGDSFYWAVLTSTSIGFGDFYPTHTRDRIFAIFYLLIGVGLFATCLGQIAAALMEHESNLAVAAFIARGVSPQLIHEMDADGSGTVEKLEFARHMLVSTGKVEARDFDQVLALFDSLDADGSGTIGPEDSNRSGMQGCEPLPPLQSNGTAGLTPEPDVPSGGGPKPSSGHLREAV